MKKLLQQSLLSALVMSITACGGSSHTHSVATTTSSTVVSSSSQTVVATTTYTVSVDVPTSFATQTAAATMPQKISQFFIATASADEVATLTAANFAVVIVDLSGKVLERVPLANSDISKNSDGSWSLVVPGNPRLDCVIVADVTKPIDLPVAGNINQDSFVFAPTTTANVAIDVGSTAAFKSFSDELGGSGTFAESSIDPKDTKQIKAVQNLVTTIRAVVATQTLTGYSNVTDALAAVKATVSDTVKQEVVNVKHPAEGTAVSLIRDEGGLFYYDGEDLEDMGYGGIAGTEEEVNYSYDNGKFVKNTKARSEGELVLSSTGWVLSSDKSKVASFNDDGSVTLQDTAADGAKQTGSVTQVFDLAGRNVSEYLLANYKTALLGRLANPETVFAAGAKGYRVQLSTPEKSYSIYYQAGAEDGTCPWNPAQMASSLGGNCNTVMMYGPAAVNALPPSDISALFSEDVEPNAAGFVAVNVPTQTNAGMLVVQLLNDTAKTERFYLQSWESGATKLIGTSTWSELTLPAIAENTQAIHIQIPRDILVIANTSVTSSSSGSKVASSEGSKTASSEGSKAASSESSKSASSAGGSVANSEGSKAASSVNSIGAKDETTTSSSKGKGGGSGDGKNLLTDYYIVKQAGFLRQLFVKEAGVNSEDAGAVFNGTASANVLTALDYTRPVTPLPTAAITVDGDATDWANVVPYLVDPAGDQQGSTSTDLTQVSIAKSGDNLAFLMKLTGNFAFPFAPERDYSNYEIAIHFYSNANCIGADNGFMVVNNFTNAAGNNGHVLNSYFEPGASQINSPATVVASAGNVLETSFNFQYLPADKGDYIALTALIHSFLGKQALDHDVNNQQKTCLKIR